MRHTQFGCLPRFDIKWSGLLLPSGLHGSTQSSQVTHLCFEVQCFLGTCRKTGRSWGVNREVSVIGNMLRTGNPCEGRRDLCLCLEDQEDFSKYCKQSRKGTPSCKLKTSISRKEDLRALLITKWTYKEILMLCSESAKTKLLTWLAICHLTEVKAPQTIHGYNRVCWYKFEEVWELLLKLLYFLSFFLPSVLLFLSPFLLATILSFSGLQRKEDLLFCCQLQPYPWLQFGTRGKRYELLTALQLSKGAGFLHEYSRSWIHPEIEKWGGREEGYSCYPLSEHQNLLFISCPNFLILYLGPSKTWRRTLTALP